MEPPAPGTSDTELGDLESSIDAPPAEESSEGSEARHEPGEAEQPEAGQGAVGEALGAPGSSGAGPSGPEEAPAVPAMPAGVENDGEPVPDLSQAAAEARGEADQEAEVERHEDEAEASQASPGAEARAGSPSDQAAPPEGSLEAGAQAEDPEATEADVSSAANAEVESAAAEGGSDEAVGAGGGGGGGGAPVEEERAPAPPDVTSMPPEQGLGQAAALPPAQLLATLGGVQASAQQEAGQARAQLAASPPQRPRPSGSPATVPGPGSDRAGVPPGGGPASAAAVPAGADRPARRPAEPAAARSPPPAPPAPRIPESPDGGAMGDSGAQAMRQAISQMPTRDPGLRIPAAPPARVQLQGNANPGTVDAQAAEGEASVSQAAAQAAADAGHPMGEDELYPVVPPETLRAEVPAAGDAGGGDGPSGGAAGGPAVAAGGAAGGLSTEDEAASIVAHKEHGGEVRSAVQQGSAQMAAAKADRAQKEQQERQRGDQEMARLEQESARQQAAERQSARGEVAGRRAEWRAQHREVVGTARTEAQQARSQAHQDIERERATGEEEAARHHDQGQQEAVEARRRGEEEAARERQRASQESSGGGFFGWVASRARSFFDGIRRGIQAAFNLARQAVQAALKRAQELAHAVIERARQAAVALVRAAGAALTAVANVALAAFPRLRAAAVGFIQNRVRAAESAINNLANRLKEGVSAVLNLVGRALNGLLNLMERAYLAAVNFVASAVQGIINRVKQAIEMLGQFAALVKDIATNPGQWLRNLGAALMDGVRNHLWAAFKTAVKQWFNDKVEQVVGVGRVVWNLLVRGGISLAQIGHMVWEGIKAAIPPALIALLIEKLISMLVPAAGAILVIIQGLQAAWGAASRILQAFERFFAFLRAVKTGNAGPQFAQAVAAAAIAVLDFLSNFLLTRLARGASRVGQRLRGIAQRIGQRLRGVMRRVGRRLRGVGRRIAGRARRLGQRLRDRFGRRRRQTPEQRRQREQEKKQQRLDRAVREIQPRLAGMLARGTSGIRLWAQIKWWKLRHRLTDLSVTGNSRVQFTARVNPWAQVGQGVRPTGEELRRLVHTVANDLMRHPDVQAAVADVRTSSTTNPQGRTLREHELGAGAAGLPAAVAHARAQGTQLPGPNDWNRWRLGNQGFLVHERHTPGTAAHDMMISGPSRYTPSSADRLGIDYRLQEIGQASGMGRRATAAALRQFVTTGRMPRGIPPEHAARLVRIGFLVFGRESMRNPGNLAFAAMTMRNVEHGTMSWREAFNRRGFVPDDPNQDLTTGGAFPMSFRGSSRAAADREAGAVPAGLPAAERSRRSAAVQELNRREIALAERWLSAEMRAAKLRYFDDQQHARQWIYDRLLEFYRLRRRLVPAEV